MSVGICRFILYVVPLCCIVCLLPRVKGKGKGFPYSIPSIGPRADPSVQAVSPQVTVSHPPGGRLPLLSARPAKVPPQPHSITALGQWPFGDRGHRCKQLAQCCYAALPQVDLNPRPIDRRSNTLPVAPPCCHKHNYQFFICTVNAHCYSSVTHL